MHEHKYVTLEEMEARWAEQDRRHQARPVILRRSIDAWHWTRRAWRDVRKPPPWRRVKWNLQRMRRGWADCDVWSLDSYIAQLLSGAVLKLADGHAYPGDGTEWDTPEKWDAHLKDLSARLAAWNDETFHDDVAYETTRAAVEEFGHSLGRYWD